MSMSMNIRNYYHQLINETVYDETVDNWFLMKQPWPVFSLVAFYLYFVLSLGPKWMENRKPYNLKYILICYNFYQVVFSSWMVSRLFTTKGAIPYLMKHGCIPMAREINVLLPYFYDGAWHYFFSKVIELLDTVFFVLRKKQNQVTFLHVYHHTNMVLSTWAYLKYMKGEQGVFIGVINSFVHVVMYSYYLLAAFGPRIQKYLWWKKYITQLQLVQFILVITYLFSLLLFDCKLPKFLTIYMVFQGMVQFILGVSYLIAITYHECHFPKILNYYGVIQGIIFLSLFINFYTKAYYKNKERAHQNQTDIITNGKKLD